MFITFIRSALQTIFAAKMFAANLERTAVKVCDKTLPLLSTVFSWRRRSLFFYILTQQLNKIQNYIFFYFTS